MKYLVYKTRDVFMWAAVAIVIVAAVTSAVFGFIKVGFVLFGGPHEICAQSHTKHYTWRDGQTETDTKCDAYRVVK